MWNCKKACIGDHLTLILRFYFYAHVLRLGVKKVEEQQMCCFQLQTGVFDHGEFKESDCEQGRIQKVELGAK